MKCKCGGKTTVIDTRIRGENVWRRRQCLSCGERFSTQEVEATNSEAKKIETLLSVIRENKEFNNLIGVKNGTKTK